METVWWTHRFTDDRIEEAYQACRMKELYSSSALYYYAPFPVLTLMVSFVSMLRDWDRGADLSTIIPYFVTMFFGVISTATLAFAHVVKRFRKYMDIFVALYVLLGFALCLVCISYAWTFWQSLILNRIYDKVPDMDPKVNEAVIDEINRLQAEHFTALQGLLLIGLMTMLGGLGFKPSTCITSLALSLITILWIILEGRIPGGVGFSKAIILTLCNVLPLVCIRFYSMERRHRFLAEWHHGKMVHAGRKADSILNHALKNIMADAAGQIELALEYSSGIMCSTLQAHLKSSAASLWRGMRSCRHREVYLNLVAGTYVQVKQEVNVEDFIRDLSAGRNIMISVTEAAGVRYLFDQILVGLILDNAISNAVKHGHATNPDVRVQVNTVPNRNALHFQVTNVANDHRPQLTEEFVANMIKGNKVDELPSALPTSDHIGLQHIALAAQGSGCTISLKQVGNQVTFKAVVPAMEAMSPESPLQDDANEDTSDFPTGLRVCYIDDSTIALRVVKVALEKYAFVSEANIYGEKGLSDVSRFVNAVLQGANVAILDQNLDFPEGLVRGDNIVKELKERGFGGLICIRSGNTDDGDFTNYMRAGAHLVLGKDLPISETIHRIRVAYMANLPQLSVARDVSHCDL